MQNVIHQNYLCTKSDISIQLNQRYGTMIIAVTRVWMMKMPIYDVVDVVTMWYCLVSAARTVNMVYIMSAAHMIWCTYIGIGCIDI